MDRNLYLEDTKGYIADCRDAGVPEPDFEQYGPRFVVMLWRDWLTDKAIAFLDLNERQQKVHKHTPLVRRITNIGYQSTTWASLATAKRDLEGLVGKGILVLRGAGSGTYDEVEKKRLINELDGSSRGAWGKGPSLGQQCQTDTPGS